MVDVLYVLGIYLSMCISRSVVSNSMTPWTIALQILLFLEFSRREYWSELPFPFPGDLPNSGMKLRSPALQADTLLLSPREDHPLCLLISYWHKIKEKDDSTLNMGSEPKPFQGKGLCQQKARGARPREEQKR